MTIHDPLADIIQADTHVMEALGNLWGAVEQAREEGCTWAEIGEVLGVSRQAAQQRFTTDGARRWTRDYRALQAEQLPLD